MSDSTSTEDVQMPTADAEAIFTAELTLPEPQRAELADRLLDSLGPPPKYTKEEWETELRRRIKAVDSGTADLIAMDEAMRLERQSIASARNQEHNEGDESSL